MKLSTKIRYGVRAMLEIAANYSKGTVLIREIAKKQKISEKYLEQLIIPIKSAGLVKSSRGAKGGYSLTKSPAQIKISEIVEAIEGPNFLVECIEYPGTCSLIENCVTRDVWIEIQSAIDNILSSKTLEDLVNRQQAKKKLQIGMYNI